jgi:hypothetical protein
MQSKFAYVVFPDGTDKLYDDKDVVTGKMIRNGLLRATRTVASAGGYKLSEYELVFPRRKRGVSTKHDPIAATQPKRRGGATAATQNGVAAATTEPAARPRGRRPRGVATTAPSVSPATAPVSTKSSRARRRRAAAAAAAAATQPSKPATAPATVPGR